MDDSLEHRFTKKAKTFRLHFQLSEEDVDELLKEAGVSYSKLESGKRTLTLALAEAYPLLYGIKYCDFKKVETEIPIFENLPQSTQFFIKNKPNLGNKVGLKGTKNKASYIIIAIKDFEIGHTFINSEILQLLPDPLNFDKTIEWNKGLLKGYVKNTKRSKTYKDKNGQKKRGTIYEVIKIIDKVLVERAMKNTGEK